MTQQEFDLRQALREAKDYSGFDPLPAAHKLAEAVAVLLDQSYSNDE